MSQEQFTKLVLFIKEELSIWTSDGSRIKISIPLNKLNELTQLLGVSYFETLLDCKLGYDYLIIELNDILDDKELNTLVKTFI